MAKKTIVWLAGKPPSFATFGPHCLCPLQFALRFQDITDIQKNMTAKWKLFWNRRATRV